MYEQALALYPGDIHLQRQVAKLKAELTEAPVASPLPGASTLPQEGFRRIRPGDLRDPEAVKKAIQLYERLWEADRSNREVESTLHLLRERWRTLLKSDSSAFKRSVSRRRVDVL